MVQLINFPLIWLLQTVVHWANPLKVRVGALPAGKEFAVYTE